MRDVADSAPSAPSGGGLPPGRPVQAPSGSDLARLFDEAAPRYERTRDVLAGGQSFWWRRLVRDAVAAEPGSRVLDVFAGTGTSSVPFARAGVHTVAVDFSLGMIAEGSRQYRRFGTVPEETRRAHPSTGPVRGLRGALYRAVAGLGEVQRWDARTGYAGRNADQLDAPDAPDQPDRLGEAGHGRDTGVPGVPVFRSRDKRRNLAFVAADAVALPFADASFDAVTMSFGLRNVADPTAALREFARVTRPGGRIVVCEFSRPTHAVVDAAHRRYLRSVLPRLLPRLMHPMSHHPQTYELLVRSIERWPDQRTFARMMHANGWGQVEWRNLSGGVVAVHRATRADPAGP